MIQVTKDSIREVIQRGDDYYYQDTGERVEDTKRLGVNLLAFSASIPETKEHNEAALDELEARMKALREQARRDRSK